MNVRQIAIIGGALLVAGAAFVWMRGQAGNQVATVAAPAAAKPSAVQVLVAKRDLAVGERVTPDALGWADWPESGAAPAFFVQSRNPDVLKIYENAVIRQAMVTGEPVTAAKIVEDSAKAGAMAALLTPGMRATSVTITPDSAVAGFVLPNDRVDMILTREIEFNEGGQTFNRTVTSTILENVRILAIDQNVGVGADNKTNALNGNTATVELTASDAEKLEMADKMGDISLLLRSYSDAAGPTLARTDSPAMLQPRGVAGPKAAAATAQPPQPPNIPTSQPINRPTNVAAATGVKVYRGGQ